MKNMMKWLRVLLILSYSSLWAQSADVPPTIIKAGHLVDVMTGKILDNQTIGIGARTIQEVGPLVNPPLENIGEYDGVGPRELPDALEDPCKKGQNSRLKDHFSTRKMRSFE